MALALALCYAAPLVIGTVLATGIAAGLAITGWREPALVVAVMGIATLWWLTHRRRVRGSRPSAQEVRPRD